MDASARKKAKSEVDEDMAYMEAKQHPEAIYNLEMQNQDGTFKN